MILSFKSQKFGDSMLGPDTAVDQADGRPRLLSETLAHQLAERIAVETRQKIDASDLAQVCQYYYLDKGRTTTRSIYSTGSSTNLPGN
jgi:hypothetical protein